MIYDEIREFCLTLPYVSEDIKWESLHCFSVTKKIFFAIDIENVIYRATFRTYEEFFDEMTDREGFTQAPYFARRKWVTISDINMISTDEMKNLILTSYRIIIQSLTKKLQTEIINELKSKKII